VAEFVPNQALMPSGRQLVPYVFAKFNLGVEPKKISRSLGNYARLGGNKSSVWISLWSSLSPDQQKIEVAQIMVVWFLLDKPLNQAVEFFRFDPYGI
jgi:hypothetical protein